MAYSNRVSLDTDVIFLRTIFAFSTNNVPVSTNFIMAAGCNGQIIASDALRTLETYGIGYLPSTFSTFDGEIISVSLSVLSTGVTNSMLYSTQNFLLSNICTVQSNLNVLSSYVLENVIPSSFSTVNQQIIELNSSFQGYVTTQAVTPVQLFSTTNGLIAYTDTSTSNLSTSVDARFVSYSNYVAATYTPLTMFSNLSTGVSTSFSIVNASISTTNSNFVALSNYTKLGFQNLSTGISGLSNQVVGISNLVNVLSSQTTDPYYVIGKMSTMPNVLFGSNIQVSSITSTIYLRSGNVGIGTSNPATKLDVSGSATFRGQVFGQNGSASAPAFSGLTDVDSGIFFPADGQVSITTNNEERYRFTPGAMYSISNRVEAVGYNSNKSVILEPGAINYGDNPNLLIRTTIGDTSGGVPLIEMQTPSLRMAQCLVPASGSGFGQYDAFNVYVYPQPADTVTLAYIIDASGQMGIRGTTTAGNALTVNGDLNFTGTLRQNGIPYGGGGSANVLGTISAANQVYFGSNITLSTMNLGSGTLFASNGVVGIGKINPTSPLDVSGSANITGNLAVDTNTLYVDASENRVGVLCNSPGYALDVNGDINFSGTLRQNGNPYSGGGGGGSANVLGTISAANQVYFGSNINLSTMNLGSGTLFASNGFVGVNTITPTTALDVSGAANITGNLVVDTNTLYVNAATNRVGVLCNTPSYALDVNGALNVASNLSTQMLNVSTVYNYVSTPKQIPGGPFKWISTTGAIATSANIPLFSNSTDIFSKYNAINVSFNVVAYTTQTGQGGGEWFVYRLDTDSITNNPNKFPMLPANFQSYNQNAFNYTMILNRDFKRSDTYIKLMVDYAQLTLVGESYLTYFSMTGIY